MASKKNRKPKSSGAKGFWHWIKSHKITVSMGTVLAVFAAYQGYINTGSDSLRTEIYQPLYREINGIELSIQANNTDQEFSSQTFELLTQNGNLTRIPKPLREKITQLYQKAGEARSHVTPIAHKVSILIPPEIKKIRTEVENKTWTEKALVQLNAENDLSTGSFPYVSFSLKHAARTPAIDLRDRQHPRLGNPGIVSWQVKDWARFPQSASDVTNIWPTTWFLGFDERNENWYYLITRDDLTRNHMELKDFLEPTYDTLSKDPEFQQLLQTNKSALDLLEQVKPLVADRVQQPKHLMDLIDSF